MLGLGLGMVGGARGWVAGRAGFWGVLATWVWGQQLQPQVPGHPTSICDAGVNSRKTMYFSENLIKFCTKGIRSQVLIDTLDRLLITILIDTC